MVRECKYHAHFTSRAARDRDWYFEKRSKQQSLINIQGYTLNLKWEWPPTELCNYHDNHSQQRPDSASEGKVRTRYLPVRASSEHCYLLKGLCQNSPLPTPLVFSPQAWATHPLLRQSLGYPAVPTKMARPLHFWTPGWPGARLCLVPGKNLVATF